MEKVSDYLIKIGLIFVVASLVVLIFTYFPIAKNEISYQIGKLDNQRKEIKPLDEEFGIVIPKINANSKIVSDVDPFDENDYQNALTKGVAHAKGSSYPDGIGNIFLFSHSSVDFYEALRYNSIFYLLEKLDKEDEIYLFYKKKKYVYKVVSKKLVNPSDISYLTNKTNKQTITLMTCWPPGTTFERLLVIGEIVEKK